MSMLLFAAAGLFLLAAPLAVLLVWAAMREARNREVRDCFRTRDPHE